MTGFFSKLFGGGKSASTPATATETYNGYIIEPRPKPAGSQFNIAGIIRKESDPDGPAHEFIRADTFASSDEAVRYTLIKARQIIDQQGDRLFKAGGW